MHIEIKSDPQTLLPTISSFRQLRGLSFNLQAMNIPCECTICKILLASKSIESDRFVATVAYILWR